MALLLPPGPNDNTIGKQDVWSGLRDEAGGAASVETTGDAAEGAAGTAATTAATVGENGQPLAAEAQRAVTTAAVGENGQPLAAEVQCAATAAAIGQNGHWEDWGEHGSLFKPGVLAYYIGPSDATVAQRVKVQERHVLDGATYLTVTNVHEDGPPFSVPAHNLIDKLPDKAQLPGKSEEVGGEGIGHGTRTGRGRGRGSGEQNKSGAKG